MTRLTDAPGRMTEQRARDLVRELDLLRPTKVDHLTRHERATYHAAINRTETAGRITPRHAVALLWAIRTEQETHR